MANQAMQQALADLQEMRQHGNQDDVIEAAAHLERVAATYTPFAGCCIACEGFPVAPNDPCGMCGTSSVVHEPHEWRAVDADGPPPCDGHTTFIGINSAGYACCFNAMRDGTCVMETADGAYPQMSDLRNWRLLDRPAPAA